MEIDLTKDSCICARCEEAFKVLPDACIDLVYTDPPYGMNYVSNIPGSKKWNKSGVTHSKFAKPIMNDSGNDLDWSLLSKELFRVLKPNTFLFLHCNVEFAIRNAPLFEYAGFSLKGMIPWNKKFAVGGDLKACMKRDWEPILYFAKGEPVLRPIKVVRNGQLVERKRISEIADWTFQLPKKEKCGFPTQKPLALARQVIALASDEGNIVMDCFGGSGAISRATKEMKRRVLCIEADPDVYAKHLVSGV